MKIIRSKLFLWVGIIILFAPWLAVNTNAQYSPEYYKYYSFEQVINAAVTGRDRYPFVNLSHKQYWLDSPSSPFEICLGGAFRLGHINFYTPDMMLNKHNVFSRDRMGFGGFLMYDQNGPLGYFFSEIDYSYHLPLNQNATTELSFGISAQVSNYNVNTSLFDPADLGDPELENLEQLPTLFDAGAGIYFNTEQFYAGISVNDLFATASELHEGNEEPNKQDLFFQSGYKFYLQRFELEPSVFAAKIDDEAFYYSTQLKAYYRYYNWIALSYQSVKSMRISAGIRVGRLHFVYAFEQSIDKKMALFFSNSHEIMLGINIGLFEPVGLRKTVNRTP